MQKSKLTQLVILGRIVGILASREGSKSFTNAYQAVERDLRRCFFVPPGKLDQIIQKTNARINSTAALFDIKISIDHAELSAQVLKLRSELAREAEVNKAVFEFTERPEDYLPTSVAEMYAAIESTIDLSEKVQSAFLTIEHLIAVMALLAAIHYEERKHETAKAYKKFRDDMNRELGMGAWGGLLASALSDLKASRVTGQAFLATEFDRINLVESEILEIRNKRNLFMHPSGKLYSKEEKRRLAREVDLHVTKIVNNAIVFYYGYFFFVEQTKLRRDASFEYTVRKWQGNYRANQLRTATIVSDKKLFPDDEVYFYDTKQNQVLQCSPYVLRQISPVTGDYAVYLLKYIDQKKRYHYKSFASPDDTVIKNPGVASMPTDSFDDEEFVLGK